MLVLYDLMWHGLAFPDNVVCHVQKYLILRQVRAMCRVNHQNLCETVKKLYYVLCLQRNTYCEYLKHK